MYTEKMQDSIFSKIISRDIPSHIVYEDEATFVFMDIHPAAEGHVLVIPKKQVETVWELDKETYDHLMDTVYKTAQRLRDVLNPPHIGELVVGVDVPHAHVHLIPFVRPKDMSAALGGQDMDSEPDHDALAALAARLRF